MGIFATFPNFKRRLLKFIFSSYFYRKKNGKNFAKNLNLKQLYYFCAEILFFVCFINRF
ncbi:MAG: hypothetical protein RL757_1873 [Bacteroidota bacterium]|jgi:hypothetical protein